MELTKFSNFTVWSAALNLVDSLDPTCSFFQAKKWSTEYVALWPEDQTFGLYGIRPINDQYGAFAAISKQAIRKFAIFRLIRLHWNVIKHVPIQDIAVEKNAFYVPPLQFDELASLTIIIKSLTNETGWDEIGFESVSLDFFKALQKAALSAHLICEVTEKVPTYLVDLEKIRTSYGSDFILSLSKNAREQIRRSSRLVTKELGPLTVCTPQSMDEAEGWFGRMAKLHTDRWDHMGKNKNFAAPEFYQFHLKLLTSMFDCGGAKLFRVSAGDETLSYLLIYIHNGICSFYCIGTNYNLPSNFRAGLVSHVLVIQHLIDQGLMIYDFLEGEARYKKTLANQQTEQLRCVLYKESLMFKLRRTERKMRSLFSKKRTLAGIP